MISFWGSRDTPLGGMSDNNETLTASAAHLVESKARADGVGAFLSELFCGFEREGVDYALARDYGPLPASLYTRDLDLLVGRGELERAYQVVKSAAQMLSSTVLRLDQESAIWLLVIRSDLSWVLRVDLGTPDSYTWRGVCYLKLDRALQRKVREGGTYRLQAHDIVLMQFCRDIIGTFTLRDKYHSAISCIYVDNPRTFEAELGESCGPRCAAALSEACKTGDFEHLKPLGKRMRRATIVRGLLREPLRTTSNILRYLGRRCREYVRPNGVMVAVVGPDGSGKGILIEAVNYFITGHLHFPTKVYHWRPGLLPSLGSLLLGQNEDGAPVSNPHAKKPSALIFSFLRLAYYTLDYVLGYVLLVRPYLGRKCIAAIFDRYFYDYFIDPLRVRTSLPNWLITLFRRFIPEPQLTIFLSADPRIIHERKPELTVEEIEQQIARMQSLASAVKNSVWIDSSGSIDSAAQTAIRAIISAVEQRLCRKRSSAMPLSTPGQPTADQITR